MHKVRKVRRVRRMPWLTFLLVAVTGSVMAGEWQPQGPGPSLNGQVENLTPDDEVTGAVHTVAAHPSSADTLYIGAVNGGVWRTTNATASTPNWTRLTDDKNSLSIGALEFDPTDGTSQTLVAGFGGFSSYGDAGDRFGLLRTTDGGDTWTALDGGGTLVGKNVSGVAPRGQVLVVSVNTANDFSFANIGVWRSVDGGAAFTQIATGDGSTTGLPGGVTHDLESDPSDATRLFTSVVFADSVGGTNGVYRSTNSGANWTKVSSAAMDALLISSNTNNVEIATGPSGSVFVAIVNSGVLAGVFHSTNSGDSWTALGVPGTTEDGEFIGAHPGGQGGIHLSVEADPTDTDIVYLGGDRQPFLGEASGGPGFFPNSIGANDFSGRVFRGDAGQQTIWTPLTHSGTGNNSSPHADSRDMAFDANGHLIETDDGGIYRRVNPRSDASDWVSINGDLQTTESHGLAYDTVSDVVIIGTQDTGTPEQLVTDQPTFFSVSTADGGDPAVEDFATPGLSTRYSSNQFLGNFQRRVLNASNTLQSTAFPSLIPLGGAPGVVAQFYTPIAANEQDGDRLLIGAGNGLYESTDRGNTVSQIDTNIVNGFVGDPILYGVPSNADLIFIGSGSDVLRRLAAPPTTLTTVASPNGSTVDDLTIHPDTPTNVFALANSEVFHSTNSGDSWSDVTGNLGGFDPGGLRTLAFIPATNNALVVAGDRGAYYAYESSAFSVWHRLGTGLPNAPVYELDYDATDDVLVAGLLGRGVWKLSPATGSLDVLFADGFESGDVTAWTSSVP